ncbi:hypothetical protein MRX96_032549 [Rhipicephalus microplus]
MALNAATDQQYHLLDQDGTADDQMDQLQGDHDMLVVQSERSPLVSLEPFFPANGNAEEHNDLFAIED